MRKSQPVLAILGFLSVIASGCGATMSVTRYPAFWDYPGEFNSIAIAPAQGTYGEIVDDVIMSNVASSGWYQMNSYNGQESADVVITPVVTDYGLDYSVSVTDSTGSITGHYRDGYTETMNYPYSYSETVYTGTASMSIDVSASSRGGHIDTITVSDYCRDSENWYPRLPPSDINLAGGRDPEGIGPETPREPLPPPPRVPPHEAVSDMAYDHARNNVDNYWGLVACAVRDMSQSASGYIYPINKTIRIYADKVFQLVQNNEYVSSINAEKSDSFLIHFSLPDDASFNTVVVDLVSSSNEDNPIVTYEVVWDKAQPVIEYTFTASALLASSENNNKFSIRLWKDGDFILKRNFSIK